MPLVASNVLTVVIHGTFAADAHWWRLGSPGSVTFADRLEVELVSRGLSGSVWTPALDAGLNYSSFSWSGNNRHRDRIKGARQLSATLDEVARRSGATPDQPLTVNFVAHSHGGNVVLEALRHVNARVRVGAVALLGTPLITKKPAFFLGRLALTTLMLAMIYAAVVLLGIQVVTLAVTQHWFNVEQQVSAAGDVIRESISGGFVVAILLPVVVGYGWAFWLLGNWLDLAWRVVCRAAEPLARLRGISRSLAYGPSQDRIRTLLAGKPILLLTSYNDEADVLLQLGSAPGRLYREYVMAEFSAVGRLLERVLLRPIVFGILLKSLEMFLEIVALGFPAWRALWIDHDVAPADAPPYYPAPLLIHERTNVLPCVEGSVTAMHELPGPIALGAGGLRASIQGLAGEFKRQIRLRHSAYYEDQDVLHRVADFIVAVPSTSVPRIQSEKSVWPSDAFWETLLASTAALAAGIASLSSVKFALAMAFNAYFISFCGFGVVWAFNAAFRRRPLAHPRVIFWSFWTLSALEGITLAIARPWEL